MWSNNNLPQGTWHFIGKGKREEHNLILELSDILCMECYENTEEPGTLRSFLQSYIHSVYKRMERMERRK